MRYAKKCIMINIHVPSRARLLYFWRPGINIPVHCVRPKTPAKVIHHAITAVLFRQLDRHLVARVQQPMMCATGQTTTLLHEEKQNLLLLLWLRA